MRKREYHPDEYHPFPTPRPFHPKNSRQLFDIPVYTGSQPPIIKEARSPKPRVELTAKSRFSSWSTFIEKQYRHKFLLGQEIPTDREPPSLSLSPKLLAGQGNRNERSDRCVFRKWKRVAHDHIASFFRGVRVHGP